MRPITFKNHIKALALTLVFTLSLVNESFAWPFARGDDEGWNDYLVRVQAAGGEANLPTGVVPIQVGFEVLPEDPAAPDTTRIQAKRFYMNRDTRTDVDTNILTFVANVLGVTTVPRNQIYVAYNGQIYIHQANVTRFGRPALPLLGLEARSYVRAAYPRDSMGVKGYKLSLAGAPADMVHNSYYAMNQAIAQEILPTLALSSQQGALKLVRIVKGTYDLLNVQTGYEFTLAQLTGHAVSFRDTCQITRGVITEPYSLFPRGLYVREGEDWNKVGMDLEPEADSTFRLIHADGPMVDVCVDPDAMVEDILPDLLHLAGHLPLGGLDFRGVSFDGDAVDALATLLVQAPLLETLSLRTGPGATNYNGIVETLIGLGSLTELDMTHCGISAENIDRLQRDGLVLIDDTPPPPESPPADIPVVVEALPQLASGETERFDGNQYSPKNSKTVYTVWFTREKKFWLDGSVTHSPWLWNQTIHSERDHWGPKISPTTPPGWDERMKAEKRAKKKKKKAEKQAKKEKKKAEKQAKKKKKNNN